MSADKPSDGVGTTTPQLPPPMSPPVPPKPPAAPALPPQPQRAVLPAGDKKTVLVENVREALLAVPFYFDTTTFIEGIEAGDLFALNSVLGGSIEIQAVAALNRLRAVWDPDDEWQGYAFVRSNQTFPDVRLVKNTTAGVETALGIELKGWYLLSKEKEPSFRYKATPDASTDYDLIAVYPWHLTSLLSGKPVLLEPFVEQSRYAAEMRNYYWEHQRGPKGGVSVLTKPQGVAPYPDPKAKVSDSVTNDSGGNFGRLARSHGLMSGYCARMVQAHIVGVPASDWIDFMKKHTDGSDPAQVSASLVRDLKNSLKTKSAAAATDIAHDVTVLAHKISQHLKP